MFFLCLLVGEETTIGDPTYLTGVIEVCHPDVNHAVTTPVPQASDEEVAAVFVVFGPLLRVGFVFRGET